MKYLNEVIVEKIVTILVLATFISSIGILFYFLSLRLGYIAQENQTYNRYISCVLSVPPEDRNKNKIDKCWTEVQKDTGIEVKRYDTHSENNPD